MKKFSLNAKVRSIFGHKSKQLRKLGKIPANVFGRNVPSLGIEVVNDEFKAVYSQAKETGLVELSVDNKVRPVLIKHVQMHPVTEAFIHVDFYQVDMNQKVTANVPVSVVGTASAVSGKLGVLLTLVNEVEVSALPADLPENIEVDVTRLANVDDSVKMKDVKLPQGVEVSLDGETELVKIGSLVTKEAEEQSKADETAAAANASVAAEAAAPESGSPGQTPAAAKPEETKKTG